MSRAPGEGHAVVKVSEAQGDLIEQLRELPDEAVRRIAERSQYEEANLQFQFERFHLAHPEVYKVLVHLARTALAAGAKHLGMKMLWERLRWEYVVGEQNAADYKLNNNHTSRYARLIMENEPDLAGLFETRELRS